MYDPTRGYATSVLLTGATGAIGRAVGRELVVSGYRVYGLVRNAEARARLPYAVIGVIGDIRDPTPWETAIERTDVLVNCAAPSNRVQGTVDRAAARREAEMLGEILDRLCDVVRRKKKRLIHTFGAPLFEPDAKGWVREASAISSGKGYGIRHRLTYPIFAKHRKKGLKAISVSPAFVYGRGGWFEHGMLDPMSEGGFTLIGDGEQTMHYIAATDAAVGYRLAIEHGLDGEDYLLADDRPTTLGTFARLVAKELGAPEPVPVPVEDLEPLLGEWLIEAYTTCPKVDSTKAREHLGWTPRFRTIDEGIPVVVREYKRARLQAAAR